MLILVIIVLFNIVRSIQSKQIHNSNAIIKENMLIGTRDWWVPQDDAANTAIHGFTESFSYDSNQIVHFKIDCPSYISKYKIEIYRLGYYNGLGGRLISTIQTQNDQLNKQPICNFEEASRMTDCSNWKRTYSWSIPTLLPSSIMIALPVYYDNDEYIKGKMNKKTNKKYYGNYIPFVIKSNSSIGSDLLFKTSDLTWVAYNKYGNYNLYRGNGSYSFSSRAYKASYNRPWQNRFLSPDGQHQNFLFGTEFPMLFWLEKHGYDVSYASCSDVEDLLPYYSNPSINAAGTIPIKTEETGSNTPSHIGSVESVEYISNYKVLLSVGHDEYWTPKLKYIYEYARELGVHLAFFSGNEIFWRVLWEESSTSTVTATYNNMNRKTSNNNHRIFQCYKETIENNNDIKKKSSNLINLQEDWTGTFRDPRQEDREAEPENTLTGQLFMVNAHRNDSLFVRNEHSTLRFWRHTSFSNYENDTKIDAMKRQSNSIVYKSSPGVLGYEWDVFSDDNARPPGLVTLSASTMRIYKSLVEEYGASYNGTGIVVHKLSLYRYHPIINKKNSLSSIYSKKIVDVLSPSSTGYTLNDSSSVRQKMCREYFNHTSTYHSESFILDKVEGKEEDHNNSRSSLVFGAGTVQWSWALSSWHDGYQMPEDRDLQQATMNILADMDVYPQIESTIDPKLTRYATSILKKKQRNSLVFPTKSDDNLPPKSYIHSAVTYGLHNHLTINPSSNPKRLGLRDRKGDNSSTSSSIWSRRRTTEPLLRKKQAMENSQMIARTSRNSRLSPRAYLKLQGNVQDFGGGVVAGVEVSLDGGKTWRMAVLSQPSKPVHRKELANMKRQWSYIYHPNPIQGMGGLGIDYALGMGMTHHPSDPRMRFHEMHSRQTKLKNKISMKKNKKSSQFECCKGIHSNTTILQYYNIYKDLEILNRCECDSDKSTSDSMDNKEYLNDIGIDVTIPGSLLVMSRAVDDSGWLENVLDIPHIVCEFEDHNLDSYHQNLNKTQQYKQNIKRLYNITQNQRNKDMKSLHAALRPSIPLTKITSNIVIFHL